MEERLFRRGDQIWLRGQPVAFIEYHFSAPTVGAVVRKQDDSMSKVVPLWKLARDRTESLARQYTTAPPAQSSGSFEH